MTDSEMIEEWADEVYAASGKETCWSVSEIRCKEEGCPPVETILTDLSVKKPCPGKGVYKVFKPIKEVTREDVEAALKEGGGGNGHEGAGHGGEHGAGHGAGHGGEGHSAECCGGHEGAGHGEHVAGHGEHAAGHGAGHSGEGHSGGCCEGHEGQGDAHGHDGGHGGEHAGGHS